MFLLQLGEQRDHSTQEDDGGLETADAEKQIQRVVERVHCEVLTVEVLGETGWRGATTNRLHARSM